MSEDKPVPYGTIEVYHGRRGPFTYRVPNEEGWPINFSDLREDDHVLVENQYGIAFGLVTGIHDEPLDDGPYNYRWAFMKVPEYWATKLSADAEVRGIEPS